MTLTQSWPVGHTRPATCARAKHRRVKTRPPLTPGEKVRHRVVSGAGTSVATNKALLHTDGGGTWRRAAWSDIAAIDGSSDGGRLTLQLWPVNSVALPSVRVAADARLESVVRE